MKTTELSRLLAPFGRVGPNGMPEAALELDRRTLVGLTAVGASAALLRQAAAVEAPLAVGQALARYAALPVDAASCLIEADGAGAGWRAAHRPDEALFVGSAVKTFILAQYLREVEAGRLSEDAQRTIDDSVRAPSSPVFLNLAGTTTARSVLEAMIAHSDNTATDVALAAAGPDSVRRLIAEAGLTRTRIPDSTRRLFSYLAGAEPGVDLGWAGIERVLTGEAPGASREPLNDDQTMVSSAAEMVAWYRQSLRGRFFTKPETLTEFRRILGMADAIALAVPPGLAAYGKGGSIDWGDFHCLCFAGQVVAERPVSFCFTINWTGAGDGVPTMSKAYIAAVAGVLAAAVEAVRR